MPFQWPYSRKNKTSRVTLAMPSAFKSVPEAKTVLDYVYPSDPTTLGKYELYKRLVETDDDLRNAIERIGQMVRYSYQGITVHAGKQLDEREKKLLVECRAFERTLNIKQLFLSISKKLMQDGDVVCLKWHDDVNKGFKGLIPLPMTDVTAVSEESQIGNVSGDTTVVVQNPKYYVLNEVLGAASDKLKKYGAEKCLVFSLDNFGYKVQDNVKRWTYGVWSMSPIESLKAKMLWKLSMMIIDILWRRRNVPRIHWQIDLEAFNPDQYSGNTIEEKQKSAQAAALTEIESFAKMLRSAEVDEGIITDLLTQAKYLEPSSMRYVSPNDLTNDLASAIYRSIGIPDASNQGSYASQIITASYTIVASEMIGEIIRTRMIELCEEHLIEKGWTREELMTEEGDQKIEIKVQLLLPAFREEMMRIAAVMMSTRSFTRDEIREVVGKEPLTDEQIKEIDEVLKATAPSWGQGPGFGNTADGVSSQFIRRRDPGNQPDTPESQHEQQITG